MASPKFRYAPLDLNRRDIRLLRLLLGRPGTIEFSLETFKIGDCPRFTALSYTWGTDDPRHAITVNLRRFLVRDSLWEALHQLSQLEHHGKYFWIDAICINQADLEERGHQVNMMRDIFSRADKTIAWLGLSDSNSALVMDAINSRSRTLGFRSRDERSIKNAVESIVQRPYFERMWIIQEVMVSRRIQVLCGSQTCSWDKMASFILNNDWAYGLAIPSTTDALLSQRIDLPMERRRRDGVSLHTLIDKFHDGECSDPKDKVYALLGMVTYPQRGLTLKADYTISSRKLYHRTLAYLNRYPELLHDSAYKERLQLKLTHALRLPSELDRVFHVVEMLSSDSARGSMCETESIAYDDEESLVTTTSFPVDTHLEWQYSTILRHVEILCGRDLKQPFPLEERYYNIVNKLSVYLEVLGDNAKWDRFRTRLRALLQNWSSYVETGLQPCGHSSNTAHRPDIPTLTTNHDSRVIDDHALPRSWLESNDQHNVMTSFQDCPESQSRPTGVSTPRSRSRDHWRPRSPPRKRRLSRSRGRGDSKP
jgi:hypothetical protein